MKKVVFFFVASLFIQFQSHAQSANFTSDSPRCVNDIMHFTPGPPGGNILQEVWDFGDGTVITYLPPATFPVYATHVYANTGTYTVTRTVKFDAVYVSFNIQVQVMALPVANFSWSPTCQGSGTQFTDLSIPGAGAIISFSWDFGDGGMSTQASPFHIYANWGIYNVTLTVINSNGCTHSVTKPVQVNPEPVAYFSFPATNCMGSPVQFTDLSYIPAGFSGFITNWVWDFGDGTPPSSVFFPNNPNVTHTYAGFATAHVVRLTVTSSMGCTDYVEKIVTSTPAPVANFSQSATACEFQPVQFTDISHTNGGGVIVAFNWSFGDPASGINNSSTAQNPVHIFSSPGTYMVQLTVINSNGCTNTMIKAVNIYPHPYANFIADTVYLGTPTTFMDLSSTSSGTIVSWFWEFGDAQTSALSNPTHLYAISGTFQVKLTITTSNGCTKDTTKQVVVMVDPGTNPPATRTITNVIVGSGQTKCYNASQLITIAGNGTLFFVLNGGSATFIAGQKISYLPGSTIQAGSYMWGYIAPTGPWCLFPSMPAVTESTADTETEIKKSSFSVYPNPTTGTFFLELKDETPVGRVFVDVTGMRGEKILCREINEERKQAFSLADRPAGIYFIRVLTGDKSETVKVIRQ